MPPADLHLATPTKASESPTASAWAARQPRESWGCELRDPLHPADEFFLGANRSHGNSRNEASNRRDHGLIGCRSGRRLAMA